MKVVPPPIAGPSEDLCLDFANTLSWRGSAISTEKLSRFGDLLDWLVVSGCMAPELREQASAWAAADPERVGRLFAKAIALREAIYRMLAAASSGEPADDGDLAELNAALAGAPPRTRLVRRERAYAWAAEQAGIAVPLLLAPVLWSAADLLARGDISGDHSRVRRCANDQCLWLFIDHSKGGTRRWCDMSSCGNRAKSRRHYLKTKPYLKTRPGTSHQSP